MMKKVLFGTLALTLMFSASAFATEVSENHSESVKSYSYTNEDNFTVKVQEKTFKPSSDGSGITLALVLTGHAVRN
jgi:ABC-type oligopeptide transport system substrate-binding subunit